MPDALKLTHTIRMHTSDNVAIVANNGGLAAGTALASGLVLIDTLSLVCMRMVWGSFKASGMGLLLS